MFAFLSLPCDFRDRSVATKHEEYISIDATVSPLLAFHYTRRFEHSACGRLTNAAKARPPAGRCCAGFVLGAAFEEEFSMMSPMPDMIFRPGRP
jgi:hypothetical protein